MIIRRQILLSGLIYKVNWFMAREHVRVGDALLFAGEDFVGNIISFVTKSDITHVAAVFSKQENGQKRWMMMEANEAEGEFLEGKVAPAYISNRIKKYDGKVFWAPLLPEFEPYRQTMKKSLAKYEGVGYDYVSLVANILPGHRDVSVDTILCSELYEIMCLESIPRSHLEQYKGVPEVDLMLEKKPQMLVPGEIALLPFFYFPLIRVVLEDFPQYQK